MKFTPAWCLAALVSLHPACADEPNCEALEEPCDIRKASCRREVYRVTACERDQSEASLPDTRLITRAELRTELEAELTQAEPTRQDVAWERGAALLGLLPADQTSSEAYLDFAVDGIAAYYSPGSGQVTVISDAATDAADGTFVLSHEYTHALQDQREGLRDFYGTHADSSDAVVALDSLIEGEASLVSNLVMARTLYGGDPAGLDFESYFRDMFLESLDSIRASSAPLVAALEILPYPLGGRVLADAYLDGGNGEVRAFYDEPWVTLARWVSASATALPEVLSCHVPEAPTSYERVAVDRLGLAGLIALELALGAEDFEWILAGELHWTADRIAVYAPPDSEATVAVAWRLQLATPEQAIPIVALIEAGALPIQVRRSGRELLLASATDADVLAGWGALEACPTNPPAAAARGTSPLAAAWRRHRTRLMQ